MKKQLFNKQKVGSLGEEICCRYLTGKGFSILDRNYRKFFGEIDIIAKKGVKIFFFEVKTVTRENLEQKSVNFRAEDNLHPWKVAKLIKTINYYLLQNNLGEGEWQLDALTVLLDPVNKKAKIERIENIVF